MINPYTSYNPLLYNAILRKKLKAKGPSSFKTLIIIINIYNNSP
jgi:hypothetical protein